jgi:SH3 domain protein
MCHGVFAPHSYRAARPHYRVGRRGWQGRAHQRRGAARFSASSRLLDSPPACLHRDAPVIRSLTLFLSVLLISEPLSAQEMRRWITDEINVAVRTAPRGDAEIMSLVGSGTVVELLESLGEQSFARVRLADGREGWLPTRYLVMQPAARDQLGELQRDLQAARQRAQTLEQERDQLRARLDEVAPALALAEENEGLRAALAQSDQERQRMLARYGEGRTQRRNLLTGAGILLGGMALGLLLPWLRARRRRRWGEL